MLENLYLKDSNDLKSEDRFKSLLYSPYDLLLEMVISTLQTEYPDIEFKHTKEMVVNSKIFLLETSQKIDFKREITIEDHKIYEGCDADYISFDEKNHKITLPLKNFNDSTTRDKIFEFDTRKYEEFKRFIGTRRCTGINAWPPKKGQRCGRWIKDPSGRCKDHPLK